MAVAENSKFKTKIRLTQSNRSLLSQQAGWDREIRVPFAAGFWVKSGSLAVKTQNSKLITHNYLKCVLFCQSLFCGFTFLGWLTLPIFLGLCLLGLAVGSPLLPVWLEMFLVAVAGIVPVLWMQWFRPFYIFSILVVAVKPQNLTSLQQRILTRFKTKLNKGIALFVAVLLTVILWQLYQLAPFAFFRWLPFLLPGGGLDCCWQLLLF